MDLSDEGVRVVGAARTVTPELEKVAVATIAADLATPEGATTVVETALAELGGVDILINNVGGGDGGELGGFLDVDDQQWHDLFARNLYSAVWTSRTALPHLIERCGAVVFVSSVNARVPSTGPVGYSEEFGPQGLRVNTVSPGVTGTDIWRGADGVGAERAGVSGVSLDDFLGALPARARITSGRITEPEEVATLVTSSSPARRPTCSAPTS
ncbi:SDR family NAD(P)-dependent oxidoreductase [Amycolatopsis sp. GM8]|uniref:SDR family NAD(P)-dependent oxidoreductase n=1 Tax=Amycolatopsis sp. GM8 TaxID=2896530 RepID=UPI001F23B04D|nr:SDR family NAD(P)-dependent oxidoreductase [Amycolatopsis sp. GM8]